MNDFAESYISPISSHLAYSFLIWLGYPVTISGTTITVVSQSGQNVSATVAGACSGIEGMVITTIMLIGLLMGSKMKYWLRTILVVVGALTMFFLNALRLSLIFISAYYWGHEGLNISHHWLGNIIFLVFILGYWYLIDKYFIRKKVSGDGSSATH